MSTTYHNSTGDVTVTVPGGEEPSLGKLVASATKDLSALVRAEVELAKTELRNEVKHAVAGSGMFIVAGLLGLLALIMLVIAAALGLTALGLPNSLAFLIVAIVILLVAGGLVFIGIKQVKRISAPERTIRTTKDSVSLIKGSAKH
ncbi:putative superfamily III holin-X [Motilibacter rhizosphaerae]|uniref:Putative superfamily III holin-X n=1 Tax=Motilibacter rhizosphaerae TaxID=598652 RepID=A0A4Q7NA68_9ACTN|nr:phage holin family protein [Motilibacter rhizosphaerae]RZS79383.1 putative superfamily III holin-X [Motilibacter rhizosphaerae]